jgi:hypothetical protein
MPHAYVKALYWADFYLISKQHQRPILGAGDEGLIAKLNFLVLSKS